MKKFIPLITLIAIIFFSCKKNTNYLKHKGHKENKITSLLMDTITIDASNTSCIGRFFMKDTLIIFGDNLFASLYNYNLDGSFINRKLGKGKGPNEIPREPLFFSLNNNKPNVLAYDNNGMMYLINTKSWSIENKGRINFHYNINQNKKEYDNVSYYNLFIRMVSSFGFYEVRDSLLIFPVKDRNPEIDCYNPATTKKYYHSTKTFAFANKNSFNVSNVTGGYPSSYLKNDSWRAYTYYSTTIKKDTLFVSHFPDSTLYIYSFPYKHPENLEYTMGYKGKNMNQDYPVITSRKEAHSRGKDEILKYGFYSHLFFIEETNILFRCYHKGSHSDKSGLQIYKGLNLIGDINVPKYFKLIGYKDPYYYGVNYQTNPYKQTFKLYRFKFN